MTSYRSVYRFSADLDRIEQLIGRRCDAVVANVGSRLAQEVIVGAKFSPGTPKDTGFTQNNWVVGINTPGAPKPSVHTGQPVPVRSLEEALSKLVNMRPGDIAYYMNNAPWMNKLENGSSTQAPRGFVAITMAAGQDIMEEEVAAARSIR